MATSLKTWSATTPCHASRLRSNFTAVPNWRWKNAPPLPPSTLQQEAPVSSDIHTTYFNTIHHVEVPVFLDATVCRHLFTAKSLYMFRVSQHPSSGALKTVTATSGIRHNTGTATSFQRGLISPDKTTLEGSSCTSIMTYTRGSGYSF